MGDPKRRLARIATPEGKRLSSSFAPASITPMPTKGRPKEIVRLSEEAVERLAKRAEDEGVPKSTIMRRAIYRELGIKEDA